MAGVVRVWIDNTYEDGHTSKTDVELETPTGPLEDWWEDVVFPRTGDSHGANSDLGFCYTATIVKADDRSLIGESHEWSGK